MKRKSMMKVLISFLLMGWVFLVQAAGYAPAITTGYPRHSVHVSTNCLDSNR